MYMAEGDKCPSRTGNRHGGLGNSPYNSYRTADGFVVLNAPGDHNFHAMLRVIGREDLQDDPRFVSRGSRVANMAAVDELPAGWASQHPKAEIPQPLLNRKKLWEGQGCTVPLIIGVWRNIKKKNI